MRLNVDYKNLESLLERLQETLPDSEKLTRVEVKRLEAIFCRMTEISNGGWISVKDRLPNKGQIVIASDGEHTWDVGMYKSFCGKPSEWNWKKNTVKTVLWWMPKDGALPEPPKEVNNG